MAAPPTGQRGTGTPAENLPNPKTTNRPDSIGKARGEDLMPDRRGNKDTTWINEDSPNAVKNSNASGVPNPDMLNPYVEEAATGSRRTRNTGANRQRFGIDNPEGLNRTSGKGEQSPKLTGSGGD